MHEISKQAAYKLVEALHQVIQSDVNYINTDGVIIASSNPSRLGGSHNTAKKIIHEDLDSYVTEQNEETSYVKEGVNFPIRLDGQIVGVIAITGPLDQVKPYASIVRQMAEIMMEDQLIKEGDSNQRRLKYRYLEDLVNNPHYWNDPDFIKKGVRFGVHVKADWQVVVASQDEGAYLEKTARENQDLVSIDRAIRLFANKHFKNAYLYLPSHYTFFVDLPEQELESQLDILNQQLEKGFDAQLYFGIGPRASSDISISTSYQLALKSTQLAKDHGKKIVHYNDLFVENYLDDISIDRMRAYVNELLREVPKAEQQELIDFISLYFEYEGSVKRMARFMFIHINTVQYRLQKILEQTGFDIRKPSESIYFHLLLHFYKTINSVGYN